MNWFECAIYVHLQLENIKDLFSYFIQDSLCGVLFHAKVSCRDEGLAFGPWFFVTSLSRRELVRDYWEVAGLRNPTPQSWGVKSTQIYGATTSGVVLCLRLIRTVQKRATGIEQNQATLPCEEKGQCWRLFCLEEKQVRGNRTEVSKITHAMEKEERENFVSLTIL